MLMMRWPTKLEWPREKMNVYVEEVQGVKLFFHELKNGSNLLEECSRWLLQNVQQRDIIIPCCEYRTSNWCKEKMYQIM